MYSYTKAIRPYVEAELTAAKTAHDQGDSVTEFRHLERAHVLGQASTSQHVRAHWYMLVWALRQRAPREFFGQIVRIIGATTKTAFGLVPTGNTGGANISPVQPLPVPADLAFIIEQAQRRSK